MHATFHSWNHDWVRDDTQTRLGRGMGPSKQYRVGVGVGVGGNVLMGRDVG